MKKNTDIPRFEQLFELWLNADTNIEQEQELRQLAECLSATDCDVSVRRDIELILQTSASDIVTPPEFNRFLNELTGDKPRHKRIRPLFILSCAATLAAIISIGLWVQRKDHINSDKEQTIVLAEAKQITTPIQTISDTISIPTTQSIYPTTTHTPDMTERPAKKASERKSTNRPAEPELLEVREITDTREAVEIITDSYALLAECLNKADNESKQATAAMIENINKVYEII